MNRRELLATAARVATAAVAGRGWSRAIAADTAPAATSPSASGPLRVARANPRYFADGTGRPVCLVGSHNWLSLQNYGATRPPPPFDWAGYLSNLVAWNHNFMRMWMWEQARWASWIRSGGDCWFDPLPYQRTGPGNAIDGLPKFDLTRFNQPFFDRLRRRVMEAGRHGIYVSIMLFQGWSVSRNVGKGPDPWPGHPCHRDNNVNGIDGDLDGKGHGLGCHTLANPTITRLQEALVRKIIDTVNDLDNVLYEICNEDMYSPETVRWQYHMIDYIRRYESARPKQHPVGMTHCCHAKVDRYLHESPADWISPAYDGDYKKNPRAAAGDKVILLDTDHLWGIGGNADWVWKSFMRGHNPIFMDDLTDLLSRPGAEKWEIEVRQAMTRVRGWAGRINLAALVPQNGGETPASSGYCLFDTAREYLVYQPQAGPIQLDLSAGEYEYEYSSTDGEPGVRCSPLSWPGGRWHCQAPPAGRGVLHLYRARRS